MIPAPPRLPATARTTSFVPGKVSIVLLNWNAAAFVERALRSIARHTRPPYELVVVDNGSSDGSKALIRDFLAAHPAVDGRFLDLPENRYFSAGYNAGFRACAADAEYLMVFCNDVEVKRDGWLDDLVGALQRPGVVAAGHARARHPVSAEQREIFERNLPAYDDPQLALRMRELLERPGTTYTHLYGYCFLLRRELLERTGLYLEGGEFRQYHSDWEWYLRFRALGLEVADAPPAVHHWHGISELVALYPHRYRELVDTLGDPGTLARYLREGRPLFEEESGYRALQAQAARRGAAGAR